MEVTSLKKLFLVVCLLVLAAPLASFAGSNKPKPKGAAPEMPGVALGVAAAIGVTGYLVLRRRRAHQN